MNQKERIHNSYKRGANKYDSMLATQKWWARLACRIIWGFQDTAYAGKLLEWLPDSFEGNLLDVPVGTGLFTASKYRKMASANITCLDYSEDMMHVAERRFQDMDIKNVAFVQGDVGALPFADESFDIVLSMNGFHAFPDKAAAFLETCRVLKNRGQFVGCFYIQGERKRTDWFINTFYVPKGYFTPPFMTRNELVDKLNNLYSSVELFTVGSIVCFRCAK